MPKFLTMFVSMILAVTVASAVRAQAPRVPAEWEPQDAVWLQWPVAVEHWYRPEFAEIIRELAPYENVKLLVQTPQMQTNARNYLLARSVPLDHVEFHVVPYDWSWLRDNGPVWVENEGQIVIQDFGFDAWGLDAPNFADDDAVPQTIAQITGFQREDRNTYILEKGNAEFNGVGDAILSWTVQNLRNPGMTRAQHEAILIESWGLDRIVWVEGDPLPGDVTEGHIDGIARFIDADTVVVCREPAGSPDEAYFDDAATIIEAAGFEVLRLDNRGTINHFGFPVWVSYLNWLVTDGAVLVPAFDRPQWDNAARATIQSYFPNREIIMVTALEIAVGGGGIHCVTNDQPSTPATLTCPGDCTGDGVVDFSDLVAMLGQFGTSGTNPACDADGSGTIDFGDLVAALGTFGACE